jgi:hypothetical protein
MLAFPPLTHGNPSGKDFGNSPNIYIALRKIQKTIFVDFFGWLVILNAEVYFQKNLTIWIWL